MQTGFTLVAFAVFVVVLITIVKAIRVVPQQHAWVVERLGSAKLPARESELPLGEIDDWGPEEHWEDWGGGPDNQER